MEKADDKQDNFSESLRDEKEINQRGKPNRKYKVVVRVASLEMQLNIQGLGEEESVIWRSGNKPRP